MSIIFNETLEKIDEIAEKFKFVQTDPRNIKYFLYSLSSKKPRFVTCQAIPETLNDRIFFITHGWRSSGNVAWISNMAKLFLEKYPKITVLALDWHIDANKDYLHAASSVESISDYVTEFITCIGRSKNNLDLLLSNLQLLGHSLGAHIFGLVGQRLNGSISRISGFDPAGPLFTYPVLVNENFRLSVDDAKFVDVIHTEAGMAGAQISIGHLDFYPNGGVAPQLPCLQKTEKLNVGKVRSSLQLSGLMPVRSG